MCSPTLSTFHKFKGTYTRNERTQVYFYPCYALLNLSESKYPTQNSFGAMN